MVPKILCWKYTVSKFGDETSISKYVRDQGIEKEYKVLHKTQQ